MKVKEIIEILGVTADELLQKLYNIDVEADLETDIDPTIVKKLSKVYKTEIKPKKKIVEK
jgi:hypothetical protein